MTHQHTAQRTTRERGYTHPVAVHPYTDENPCAHGGITYHEVCACGADRAVNVNQMHEEVGPWGGPERRFVGRTGSGEGYYVYVTVDGRAVRASGAVEDEGGRWSETWAVDPSHVPAEALRLVGATL